MPSTEVEGNLLECPADGQVKPIVGSALASQREVCDEASLPFAAESQTRLAEVERRVRCPASRREREASR